MDDSLDVFEDQLRTPCDVVSQLWMAMETPLGDYVKTSDEVVVTGKCPNEGTRLIYVRVCPCISQSKDNYREHIRNGTFPDTIYGLVVFQTFACDAHQRWFQNMHYPFICSGCGIVYEEYDHLVVHEGPAL